MNDVERHFLEYRKALKAAQSALDGIYGHSKQTMQPQRLREMASFMRTHLEMLEVNAFMLNDLIAEKEAFPKGGNRISLFMADRIQEECEPRTKGVLR